MLHAVKFENGANLELKNLQPLSRFLLLRTWHRQPNNSNRKRLLRRRNSHNDDDDNDANDDDNNNNNDNNARVIIKMHNCATVSDLQCPLY